MSTISLGGVVLNGGMVLSDRTQSSDVAQSVKRTLSGNLKVFFSSLTKGRPVTLEATEDQGWITQAMVNDLMEMANSPGGVYSLLVNGVSTSVIFRHHEAPAFVATPLVYRNNSQSGDYYTCTIKLLTI